MGTYQPLIYKIATEPHEFETDSSFELPHICRRDSAALCQSRKAADRPL